MSNSSAGQGAPANVSLETQRETKFKHLEFIQITIIRMAANSFLIKGWSVTIIAALAAVASNDTPAWARVWFCFVALLVTILFWSLDAYYLFQERLYRALYNSVIEKGDCEVDFDMDVSKFYRAVNKKIRDRPHPKDAPHIELVGMMASRTLAWFHGAIFATVCVLTIVFVIVALSSNKSLASGAKPAATSTQQPSVNGSASKSTGNVLAARTTVPAASRIKKTP